MFAVCSFCGVQAVVSWYEGPDFAVSVHSPKEVQSEEAWLACSECTQMVESNDRAGLALRNAGRLRDESLVSFSSEQLDREFWSHRDRS